MANTGGGVTSIQQQISLDNIRYSVQYTCINNIILRARRIHVITALVSIVKSAIVVALGVVFLCAWILRDAFLWELLTLFILSLVELVAATLLMIDTSSYMAWSKNTNMDHYARYSNQRVKPICAAISRKFLEVTMIMNIIFLFTLVITVSIYIWTTRFADGVGYMLLFIVMFALAATSLAELVLSILLITHRIRITTLYRFAIDVVADVTHPVYNDTNNNYNNKAPLHVHLFLNPRTD